MQWVGTWRNQYGSLVEITDGSHGRIRGIFRIALEDSSDVIGFTAAAEGSAGPAAVSYTGLLRDGKLETMWHTVAGSTLTTGRAKGRWGVACVRHQS